MGKIDSISAALKTEYGIDLSTGKHVINHDHDMNDPEPLLPIEVVEVVEEEIPVQEVAVYDNVGEKTKEEMADEERVKRNMRELIEKSMELADDMFETVRVAESPKAYEPAAAFLKTIVELNEKLLEVHDRDRKIKAGNKKDQESSGTTNNQTNNTQNNTVIYATPVEMMKMIKSKK